MHGRYQVKAWWRYSGTTLLVGNEELLYDAGVEVGRASETLSVVYVARDSQHLTTFYLTDELKEDARAAVQLCESSGYNCHVLSGDRHEAVVAVAAQLGIASGRVYSNKTVADKVACVQAIERDYLPRTSKRPKSRAVLMLGDGINDAPALKIATVGASIASFATDDETTGGTDVAIEAADLILTSRANHLTSVPTVLALAQAVRRRCIYNLVLATVWNVVAIPFACGAFLPLRRDIRMPPALAAASMSLSCLAIIASSLYLSRWRPADRVIERV